MIFGKKNKNVLALFFVLGLSFHLNAQKARTSQDSIKVFYNQLFSTLKKGYLHKKSVDWQYVESETEQNLKKYNNFKSSLDEIKTLFSKIGATHCAVYNNQRKYGITANIPAKENFSDQWKKKNEVKPDFEAKIIDGKYGYILMPKMVFSDVSTEKIHKIAQPLYDQIADVKTKNKIEGWIIDLRFNTGGNAEPMLLALYDFLGDNDIWGTLDVNKKQESKCKLSKGIYVCNFKKESYITPKGNLLDNTKVALITGLITASAGEVIALAFKGRPSTVFIGETTLGYTTGNILAKLPFDFMMALTTSYDSDRNGVYYERIIPDIAVSKEDNFDNLLLDKNIQEAIQFFQ